MAYGRKIQHVTLSDPDYWVELKPSMSYGFARRLASIEDDDESMYSLMVHVLHDWNLETPCPDCSGEGRTEGLKCGKCNGGGYLDGIAPITADTVGLLTADDMRLIGDEVRKANNVVENLPKTGDGSEPSGNGSKATGQRPKSLPTLTSPEELGQSSESPPTA